MVTAEPVPINPAGCLVPRSRNIGMRFWLDSPKMNDLRASGCDGSGKALATADLVARALSKPTSSSTCWIEIAARTAPKSIPDIATRLNREEEPVHVFNGHWPNSTD